MKARTAREKKLYRYMMRSAQVRPNDYADPCIERWLNRRADRQNARNRLATNDRKKNQP